MGGLNKKSQAPGITIINKPINHKNNPINKYFLHFVVFKILFIFKYTFFFKKKKNIIFGAKKMKFVIFLLIVICSVRSEHSFSEKAEIRNINCTKKLRTSLLKFVIEEYPKLKCEQLNEYLECIGHWDHLEHRISISIEYKQVGYKRMFASNNGLGWNLDGPHPRASEF